MSCGSRSGTAADLDRRWVVGFLLCVLAGLALSPIGSPPAAATRQGDPLTSACGVSARLNSSPGLVPLGGAVSVYDHFLFSCQEERRPFHLALVAWQGDPIADWVPAALRGLGADVALATHPLVGVGLTTYGASARALCGIERDPVRLDLCLSRLGRETPPGAGAAGLASALHEAGKSLELAAALLGDPFRGDGTLEAVLAVVPPNLSACAAAERELASLRDAGVDLSLVCAGADCADHCLRDHVAPGRFHAATDWDTVLHRLVGQARASELRVTQVVVRQSLSAGAKLVPGSADPLPWYHDPASGALAWRYFMQAQDGLRLNYSVRPSGLGTVPLVDGGLVVYTDSYGLSGSLVLPARRAVMGWPALLPAALREERGLHP